MRNHLAEECLNSAMWSLIKCYSESLDEKRRKELTGSLQFLAITSDLICFVNNDAPVLHLGDSRFSVLEITISFFSNWEKDILARADIDTAIKKLLLNVP